MNQFEKNPNPTKDQHFMVDVKMLECICRKANIQEGETIVEVGGGAGALTDFLARGNNSITVIEKDPYYANFIKSKFQSNPNVKIIEGDALNFDYFDYDRIVANLPYTITESFLIRLAKDGVLAHNPKDDKSSAIKSITLVLSQNSVRKMVAPLELTENNSKHFNSEFGLMSTICHSFLDIDIDRAIPSEAFFPEPAVTSFLVNLTPKKKKTSVDRVLQAIFMDRKGDSATIHRVYQRLIAQGKIYNLKKYKGNSLDTSFTTCTSKAIGNKNIFDLTNSQMSQFIKDLIRNDSKIKGSKARTRLLDPYEEYERYKAYQYASQDYDEYDDDEFLDEVEIRSKTKSQKKAEAKYSYWYDETKFNVLLKRKLEYMPQNELAEMLANGI